MDQPTLREIAARLNYVCEGGGSDILLVHGFASSARMWTPLIHRFQDRARWWAVNLCGFGDSCNVASASLSLDDHVAILAAFCEHHQLRPRAVVGHSMGGLLTVKLALARPDLMERLVLVCPVISGKISFHAQHLIATRLGGALLSLSRPVWRALQSKWVEPLAYLPRYYVSRAVRERIVKEFQQADWRVSITALQELARADVSSSLPQIQHQALVVVGGRDFTVSPDEGRMAARLLPNARLVEYPRAHHQILDEEPDAFLALMEQFLFDSCASHVDRNLVHDTMKLE